MSAWNYLWEAVRTHPFNFFTLLFALAALIVSIFAARAAHTEATEATRTRQLNEKAIAEQAETLRRQAAIAERSAEAAHRSATAAEDSARLAAHGQRAWILVNTVKAQIHPVYPDRREPLPQFRLSVVTALKNSGQTVAQALRMHQVLRLGAFDADNPPEQLRLDDRAAAAPLGAGEFAQIPNGIEVQGDDWRAVLKGQQKVSLVGRAEYRDVFGVPHETMWLMEYDPTAEAFHFAPCFNSMT